MNARHAARELALLTLFQSEKQGRKSDQKDGQTDDKSEKGAIPQKPFEELEAPQRVIHEMVLASVRALSDQASEQVQDAAKSLSAVSQYLVDLEYRHADNQELSMHEPVKPVALPNSRELLEKIEDCLQAAEYLAEAQRIPELMALAKQPKVQTFAVKLVQRAHGNQAHLDETLSRFCQDWHIDRLNKMDRTLLRLALTEILYFPDIATGVTINETVELAKQFSMPEGHRFINGVLGKIAEALEEGTLTPVEDASASTEAVDTQMDTLVESVLDTGTAG
ncbi:MAG: transcription antitermination factor NusB [Vampirovibrio sp.]|nr:transcription antitermination factor NusB [Vampirovibrio sp.]